MPRSRKSLTPVARRLRNDPTEAEKLIWRALRDEPFKAFHFRRQVPLGPFVVDFASHAAKFVIELDGGQHAEPRHAAADAQRDAALAAHGYRVLRIWNSDVFENRDGVLDTVLRALYHDADISDGVAVTPAPDPSERHGGE